MTVSQLAAMIADARQVGEMEGISLLGGEPFAQAEALSHVARYARSVGLSVMAFTGYTLEELKGMSSPGCRDLLESLDILVDGRYDQEQPDDQRRWVGSRNQRVHFFTERYRMDDPCWRQANTLELRWRDGSLSVNGFPATSAVGLWRRPRALKSPQND